MMWPRDYNQEPFRALLLRPTAVRGVPEARRVLEAQVDREAKELPVPLNAEAPMLVRLVHLALRDDRAPQAGMVPTARSSITDPRVKGRPRSDSKRMLDGPNYCNPHCDP